MASTKGVRRGLRWACLGLSALLGAEAKAEWAVRPGLQLSLEERYDDDVVLRTSTGGLGGELMTKLTPQGLLDVESRTTHLESFYATDFYVRHRSGSAILDHRGGLELAHRFGPRASFHGDVKLWRVSDPTSLPRMGLARSAVPVFYGLADSRLDVQLSRRWLLRPAYRFEGVQILDDAYQPGFVHVPSVDALYQLDRRTHLGVGYRFQSFVLGQETSMANGVGASLIHRLNRLSTLTVRGGPVWYRGGGEGQAGVLPRVSVDLYTETPWWDWALSVGHDLVGASGFTTALWADYAALSGNWRLRRGLHLFGMVNYFRNGPAPNVGVWPGTDSTTVSQGYGLGAGLEWRVSPVLALQGNLTRIQQVGTVDIAAADLTRNIASVRAVFTAWE